MVRFSSVLITYFVIGAVLWGGGAIGYDDAGVATLLVDGGESGPNIEQTNEGLIDEILGGDGNSGITSTVVGVVGGPILAFINLVGGFIQFLFWPIATLYSVNAPPEVVILAGGTPTVAFYAGAIRTVRGSA